MLITNSNLNLSGHCYCLPRTSNWHWLHTRNNDQTKLRDMRFHIVIQK